jgi:ligand-binding sensor protein
MLDLEKWAETEEFKQIQQVFQKATGVACRLIDYKGRAVAPENESVSILKESENWREIQKALEKSAREASIQAVTDGDVLMYRALEELTFFVVPFERDGEYLGAVQGGPVRVADHFHEVVNDEAGQNKKAQTFFKVNRKLIDALPVVTPEQLKGTAEMAKLWLGKYIDLEKQLDQQAKRNKQNATIIEQQYRKIEAYERREHQPREENLENRLNMHFWFNSLTSAANLAIIEGAMRTNEMITLISDFLRDTLFEHDTFWTVAQETEAVECYLHIQGVRFGDRIQYKIDVPRNMMKCRIPRMMLVPFVEHSTNGVINQNKDGQILVRIAQESGRLICEVQDNVDREAVSDLPSEAKKHYSAAANIEAVRDKLGEIYGTGYHIAQTTENGRNCLVISIPEGGRGDV